MHAVFLRTHALAPGLLELASLAPNYFDKIMTTGYNLVDLIGDDSSNTKGNFAIYYSGILMRFPM